MAKELFKSPGINGQWVRRGCKSKSRCRRCRNSSGALGCRVGARRIGVRWERPGWGVVLLAHATMTAQSVSSHTPAATAVNGLFTWLHYAHHFARFGRFIRSKHGVHDLLRLVGAEEGLAAGADGPDEVVYDGVEVA